MAEMILYGFIIACVVAVVIRITKWAAKFVYDVAPFVLIGSLIILAVVKLGQYEKENAQTPEASVEGSSETAKH